MKNIIIAISFLMTTAANAQSPYISSTDANGTLIFNGIITKYALQNTAALNTWYTANQAGYVPDATVVNALQNAKDKKLVIFGGTWCGDTRNILPKFFMLQEKAGYPDEQISFFGVDRSKHIIGNVTQAFGITNVPTIIVMKDGKEVGRVVEYGKTGKWDTELAEILRR